MPNANYTKGRAFEYKRKKVWEFMGWHVIRASGSHGEFDLIAYDWARKPAFIQCKVVKTLAEANRLIEEFKRNTNSAEHYHQHMEIWVAKTRELRSWVV